MDTDEIEARSLFGTQLTRKAGELIMEDMKNSTAVLASSKGVQDWVTNLDIETEEFIRDSILREYPGDNILGEEQGGTLDGIAWVIDPIDGTANFIRKTPLWCVSVALVVHGKTMLGFIYAPMLDEMFVAQRDRGAWLNGNAVTVSENVSPESATIEPCWTRSTRFGPFKDPIEDLYERGYEIQRLGTGALVLAWIAAGRMDGYCEVAMNAWDGLAGWLMVREAGGAVNDYESACIVDFRGPIAVGSTIDIQKHLATAINLSAIPGELT